MSVNNRFEIPYGATIDTLEERVFKNVMVTDVAANVEVFADLNPIHMAAIQQRLGQAGVLVCMTEQNQRDAMDHLGSKSVLNFKSIAISSEQNDLLRQIAAYEIEDPDPFDRDFMEESALRLPAIWFSEAAFASSGIYFRTLNSYHDTFQRATRYITQQLTDKLVESHREGNAKLRSHLVDAGYDMARVPKPELTEQRIHEDLVRLLGEKVMGMLAAAQTIQTVSLSPRQYAVAVAQAYVQRVTN